MKELLVNMSQSEKRTLGIVSIALVILLLYAFVWNPVVKGVDRLRATVSEQQELLVWMQASAEEVKTLRAAEGASRPTSRGGQSLLLVVDQTAKGSKLGTALKRVEPKGQNEVRVRLEEVAFDDMVRWLSGLQRRQGVNVDSISIDRQSAPGRVNANLTLKGTS